MDRSRSMSSRELLRPGREDKLDGFRQKLRHLPWTKRQRARRFREKQKMINESCYSFTIGRPASSLTPPSDDDDAPSRRPSLHILSAIASPPPPDNRPDHRRCQPDHIADGMSWLRSPSPSPALPAQKQRSSRPSSRFMALPQEIRDMIYTHVFSSTRLTMGRRITCTSPAMSSAAPAPAPATSLSPTNVTHIRPARHSLALFYVCRQIHHELHVDDAWISQVLFNFEDIATMLDVLSGTSGSEVPGCPPSPLATPAGRARVRYVRVREGSLARHTPHRGSCAFFLGGLMRLLPGLRLDRLTILPALPCRVHGVACCAGSGTGGGNRRTAAADVLGELLRAGSGWRELRYLHQDASLIAADRRRQGSLEAMMVNMGFWDVDGDALEGLFDGPNQGHNHNHGHGSNSAAASPASPATPATPSSPRRYLHRLSSFFSLYAESRELRLPAWRLVLATRDLAAATSSIDGGQSPRSPSTIHAYSGHAGRATRPMETLLDVHKARLRGDNFVVAVCRHGPPEDWEEKEGSSYLYPDGDPRTFGYGTSWPELRSFLYPWDYIPVTHTRRDKYNHRDEYSAGPLNRHGE